MNIFPGDVSDCHWPWWCEAESHERDVSKEYSPREDRICQRAGKMSAFLCVDFWFLIRVFLIYHAFFSSLILLFHHSFIYSPYLFKYCWNYLLLSAWAISYSTERILGTVGETINLFEDVQYFRGGGTISTVEGIQFYGGDTISKLEGFQYNGGRYQRYCRGHNMYNGGISLCKYCDGYSILSSKTTSNFKIIPKMLVGFLHNTEDPPHYKWYPLQCI